MHICSFVRFLLGWCSFIILICFLSRMLHYWLTQFTVLLLSFSTILADESPFKCDSVIIFSSASVISDLFFTDKWYFHLCQQDYYVLFWYPWRLICWDINGQDCPLHSFMINTRATSSYSYIIMMMISKILTYFVHFLWIYLN